MPPALLPLRTTCNAYNAYNPAVAISSALWRSLDGCNLGLPSRAGPNARSGRSQREYIPARRISTVSVKRQQAGAAVDEDAIQQVLREDAERLGIKANPEDDAKARPRVRRVSSDPRPKPRITNEKSRLGTGDTFANLEALQNFSADQNATTQPPRRVLARYTNKPPSPESEKAINRYIWPTRMSEIAKYANDIYRDQVWLSDPAKIEQHRGNLDYKGQVVALIDSQMAKPVPFPWVLRSEQISGRKVGKLIGEEIRNFEEYMTLTPAERAARDAIISDLMKIITESCDPEIYRAEVFGSERTGLVLPFSDIDIRLTLKDEPEGRYFANPLAGPMHWVLAALKKNPNYIAAVLRHAKYPIINLQHRATGIDIQIVAAPTTAPQEEVTMRYLAELPSIRPLYILLKTALSMRGLTEFFYGGTGSYGLFIMLAASLKRRQRNPAITLRGQLFHFLRFFCNLDTSKHGISVSPAKLFLKHDANSLPLKQYSSLAERRNDPVRAGQWTICRRNPVQPYLLCLQDPSNPRNDLGRKGNAIKHVIATFRYLDHKLKYQEAMVARKGILEITPGHTWSMLYVIVGRVHEVHFEQRRRLEEYGARVLAERGMGDAEAHE